MTLISETYRKLNRELHDQRPDYGTTARNYVQKIANLVEAAGDDATILDYGCGKGLLKQFLPHLNVFEYDPAIPGKDGEPSPADFLVSIDVLEHIEPDCLTDVLEHMRRKAKGVVFLTVATRPAKKTLPDGRNAHLIVETIDWWLPRLSARWSPRLLRVAERDFMYMGVAR